MTEASAQTEFDLAEFHLSPAGAGPLSVAVPDDRRFWLGVTVAALVHVMFLVGFNSQPTRFIGDPSGDKDAIGVDFITEADLRSLSSVSDQAAGRPVPPSNPVPARPPPQAEAPAPPQPQTEAPPTPAEAVPPAKPAEAEAVKPVEAEPAKPAEQAASAPKVEDAIEPAPTLEDMVETLRQRAEASRSVPEAKPEPPKPRPPQQQKQTQTRMTTLDLSLPPSVSSGPSGSGGLGFDRPAGATRSGENDNFARGVISALRQNMPQLRDTRGQVTVRITLDMNGNLVRTEVVRASALANLDQSVVFSTRQASFPFPPRNARAADLVFLVTYIYR